MSLCGGEFDLASPPAAAVCTAELRESFPALGGVEAEQVWMGVTQWTADGYPWVGPLPSQPGNYIAAGFTEGMVQCFGSGHAIAQMLAGNEAPTPFNRRYLPTARARLSEAQ